MNAAEHRRGLGVAESAGDGGSRGSDAVLGQDDQRAEDAEPGAADGQPRGPGASARASQSVPAMSRTTAMVLSVMPVIIAW